MARLKVGLKWLVLALILAVAAAFLLKQPGNDAAWQTQYRKLPQISLADDRVDIRQLRDFRYAADGKILQTNYVERSYRLSALQSLWFGLSHFGDFGLAHAFVSFGFSDGSYLAVSIEARLREDQPHYNPLSGLLRNYTKIVVLATEQDVIGLRSHVRGEPVYLYQVDAPRLQMLALLLNFLRRAEQLNREPEFYNTLTDNCLTGLLQETGSARGLVDWLDYRIALPGYSDRLIYEYQRKRRAYTFAQMRADAFVEVAGYAIDDADFSTRIRAPANADD